MYMVFAETNYIIALRLCLDVIGATHLPRLQCECGRVLKQCEHIYAISALCSDLWSAFLLQLGCLNSCFIILM
jgi:hypothetical protein